MVSNPATPGNSPIPLSRGPVPAPPERTSGCSSPDGSLTDFPGKWSSNCGTARRTAMAKPDCQVAINRAIQGVFPCYSQRRISGLGQGRRGSATRACLRRRNSDATRIRRRSRMTCQGIAPTHPIAPDGGGSRPCAALRPSAGPRSTHPTHQFFCGRDPGRLGKVAGRPPPAVGPLTRGRAVVGISRQGVFFATEADRHHRHRIRRARSRLPLPARRAAATNPGRRAPSSR